MSGTNRLTGKKIDGDEKLAQDIADVLTTPLGSRVCRRDYGSRLFQLIDAPVNAATPQLYRAATASAISRWIKRVRLEKVSFTKGETNTALVAHLAGRRLDVPNSAFAFTIPLQ